MQNGIDNMRLWSNLIQNVGKQQKNINEKVKGRKMNKVELASISRYLENSCSDNAIITFDKKRNRILFFCMAILTIIYVANI